MDHHYTFLKGILISLRKFSDEDFSAPTYKKRRSKSSYFTVIAAVLMLFCVTNIFAQARDYTFSQSTGTFVPITGGTVITTSTNGTPSLDSYSSGVLTLPAAFNFAGTSYTTFYVTSNGQVQLGGTAAPVTYEYRVLNVNTGNNVFLSPFSADLNQIATGVSDIRYEQVGNEVVIQWTNFRRYNKTESFNIQARLNTVTGVIKFVYDGTPPYDVSTSYQPQVGIKSSTTSYIGLTSAGSWNTPTEVRTGITDTALMAFNGALGFTSGLTYTFTPPTCYPPSALTATLPTSSGITLGWAASTSAPGTGYEYYISDVNTAPVAATVPSGAQATGNAATAGSLNPSTYYYAWVRSACSGTDKSSWTGPVMFLTGQVPAPIPFTDGFEDTNGWSLINGSEANKWFVGTFVNNGGTKSLYVSKNATGANNDYAHTTSTAHAYRDLAIPAGVTVAELTFDLRAGGESTYDYVRVWVTPTSYSPAAGTQTTVDLGGPGTVMVANYQNLTTGFVNRSFYAPVSAFAGQNVRLIFEWRNDSGGGVQTAGAIDNVVFKEPTCPPPTAMSAAVSPAGVTFGWTGPATAPASGYDIYYSTTNTAPTPTATISLNVPTGNSATVTTGLTADTAYYYWMRSVCSSSDMSGWVYGGTFMPDCAASTPTITQDFTGYTGAMPAPAPACWREASGLLGTSVAGSALTAGSTWTNQNYNNLAGANGTAAYINLQGTDKEWVISPGIDLGTTIDYQLEYTTSVIPVTGAGPVTDMAEKFVKVLISTDGGLTWTAANTLKTYDTANIPAGGRDEIISLASYTGVVKIAFYAYSTTNTPDLRFYIDNFRVRAIPSCIAPTAVTAGAITKNGATVSWTAATPAPANGYQYYVGTASTAPTAASTPTGNVNAGIVTANITLAPATNYFVWVRGNCGTDGQSEWIGPVAFTTLCDYKEITATTPAARCGTGTVSLSAVATGGITTWYDAAGPVGTGAAFTTPQLTETTTFYVRAVEAAAGTAVIGTGTALTGDTEQPTAFNNRFTSYKSQTIYTAAELLASGLTAGNITSIAYNVATLGSSANNTNFRVRIATTSLSSFTTTAYVATGFSTVFGPANYTHTASGWQTITFTTPYYWDGESNIILDISSNGINSSNNTQTYYTDTTNAMMLTTIADLTAANGTASTKRLNVTFAGQVGCSSPKTAVVATVSTPPVFALSSATATNCSGQPSAAVTVQTGAADYDSYVWSPSTGVTGSEAAGWVFSPTANTSYTVTATNTVSGCATTATVDVTANILPTPLTIVSSDSVCGGVATAVTVTGGLVPTTATLGTGTVAPEYTTLPNPFTAWYGGAKTQMLIKESELLALGFVPGSAINSVAFDFEVSTAAACNDLRIKIGPTTNTDMAAGLVTSGPLTTVYNANWTPTAGVTGFVPFTFTTPYLWNGGDIIVEVAHNQGNSGNGAGTRTRATATPFVSVYSKLKDGVAPAGMASYDAATENPSTIFYTYGSSSNRPNMRFNYNGPSDVTWSPVTNLYSDAAATTAYVAGSGTRTVYVKAPIGAAAITYTATATNNFGCTATATKEISVVDCGIGWANVQHPANGTITTCGSHAVFARVFKTGVTEAAGQGANITAWIGVSSSNTNPSTWAEADWHLATFNVQAENNDEYTYTISGLPAGTYYYASRFNYLNGAYAYGGFVGGIWNGTTNVSGTLTVTGVNPPTATAAQTFCNSGTVTNLAATGEAGATVSWYSAATGGTALTGTTALTDGGVYYASQTVAGCESATRTMVTATINAPAAPTATATQTFCNSGTVTNLLATGTAGATISWYSAATGGTALSGTTALTNGGTYYASQTVTGCESATRTMVTATINAPAAPTATATQTFCDAGTIADLEATGTAGATISWYSAATGGTALAGTTALTNNGEYYASQTVTDCESAIRTLVTVTISTVATPTATLIQPTCSEPTGTITVSAPVGEGFTYSLDGDAFQDSATFASLAPGTYNVTAKNASDCTAISAAIIINAIPANPNEPTVTATQTFCNSGTVADLSATGADGATITWYSSETGGTALTGTTALVDGTIYYASQTVTGCESDDRAQVTAEINVVDEPDGETTQEVTVGNAADATIEDIVVTATGTVIWYATADDALGGTNALPANTQLVDGNIYYGTQTIGTCESATFIAVTMDVVLGKDGFNRDVFSYYPNPVTDVLNISYTSEISSVTVFDLLGQQVISKQPNATEVKIDLSALADATYIVNVTAGNTVKTIKVVKKQ